MDAVGINKVALHTSALNQEMRDSMVLFVSSAIVTVFSLGDFRVLHQNPSSMRYYGNIISHDNHGGILKQKPDAVSGLDVLHHIFSLDACKMQRMLDDVDNGGVGRCWKGVIRVPPPGSLGLASVQADKTAKLEMVEELHVAVAKDIPQQGDEFGSPQLRLPLGGDESQGDDGDDAEHPTLAPSPSPFQQQLQIETSGPGRAQEPEPCAPKHEVLVPEQCNARSAADSSGGSSNATQQQGLLQDGVLIPLQHGDENSASQNSNMPSTPELGRQQDQGQVAQESQRRDDGSGAEEQCGELRTGQIGQEGLGCRDKAVVTLELCKLRCTASAVGGGTGSGDGHDQRRRQSLTPLKALVFHPHRGFSGLSGLTARERSVSGPGTSGRSLHVSTTANALDFGSGGSGRGSSSSSNKVQRHVSGATIATAAVSVSAWTLPFPFLRSNTIAHAPGPAGSIASSGGGGYGGGWEGRFSRLSRQKGVTKDLGPPLTRRSRERAISPIVGALRKARCINSQRVLAHLMPLGPNTPANAIGSVDGTAAAAASDAPSDIITGTRTDVNEQTDDPGEPSRAATGPNFSFMVPVALDGHSGPVPSGQGCQTPSLLLQSRMDGSLLRRGLSGNVSLSLSGAQLLLDTNAAPGPALTRKMVSGLMQPVSQMLQHNDPLATSTLRVSLGPLQLPLMASLPSVASSCSGLAFQPAPGPSAGLGGRGADAHTTHLITTTSSGVLGAGLLSSSAYGTVSAANHQRFQPSQAAATQPLIASGRSSATLHTFVKAAQLRGGFTTGPHRGGGGVGDSSSRFLLETTAGFATATTNTSITTATNAVGPLTCLGNSTSLVSSLSTNLDRMMTSRQWEAPPPLQPPRTRPLAPVVPQPARIQARIQTWANGDHGKQLSPAAAGFQAAFQQPTPFPPPSGNQEQVQQQHHHHRQIGRCPADSDILPGYYYTWTRKVAALATRPGKHTGPSGGGGGGGGDAGGACRKSTRKSSLGSLRLRPLATDCSSLATWHEQVTLLFADIKGFTPMCKEVQPFQVMRMLNDLFSRWDALLGTYGVHKVETIGDCYFVAGGLFCYDGDGMVVVRDRSSGNQQPDPHHARRVFEFAKAMLVAASAVPLPTSGEPVQIRVGIHSGPVVSGVVGTRMPRFCLFGDTVNTAARMESTGVPGGIHVSDTTRQLLMAEEEEEEEEGAAAATAVEDDGVGGFWTATGGIQVKGKGDMQTWLWRPAS
ncbi:hypothetical protein Vafri_11715 [Volvox africanus]|uniref:Guanylate cyclase domain-containing protein n=1 Tax=Volvox africanus TaxID=51714 RepID=A0A8J4BDA5_9CHLO|nr:hypothetical protein Vafri_11715 [Volvox africanus]